MLRNVAQRPSNNANPLGCQKKCLLRGKGCNFVGKVEISLYSKNHCGGIVIGFSDT